MKFMQTVALSFLLKKKRFEMVDILFERLKIGSEQGTGVGFEIDLGKKKY